jgi:hypothetical protein
MGAKRMVNVVLPFAAMVPCSGSMLKGDGVLLAIIPTLREESEPPDDPTSVQDQSYSRRAFVGLDTCNAIHYPPSYHSKYMHHIGAKDKSTTV